MKVFGGNFNGRFRKIVYAKSKKQAAELCKVRLHYFNDYFCETGNEIELEVAMAEPFIVFQIKMTDSIKKENYIKEQS